jgi:hypothetical protein
MAQHRLKITLAAGGLVAALMAGVCGDVRAFTETTVPPAQPQTAAPAPQLQLQKPEAGEGLSLVKPGDAKAGGTELSIPGIGSVGTLPKLDFGLDLLYGAGSDPVVQERPQENESKDVTIKGTIKHRF